MAAAGKYGHYLGEVNLTIEQGKVTDKEQSFTHLTVYLR